MNRRALLTGAAACAMVAGFPAKATPAVPPAYPGLWDSTHAEYMRRHMDHIASCMDLSYDEAGWCQDKITLRKSSATGCTEVQNQVIYGYMRALTEHARIDVIKMPAQVGFTETLMLDEWPYPNFRQRRSLIWRFLGDPVES